MQRKCRVESSTDSESDNNENFGTHLSSTPSHEITSMNMDLVKFQFRDPYDGDSEETSAPSDSSTQDPFLSETDSTTSGAKDGRVRMECTSGSAEEPETTWDDCSLASCDLQDVSLRPQASADCQGRTLCVGERTSCVPSQSHPSGVSGTESASLTPGLFVLIDVNPKVTHFTPSVLAASLTSEENSDFSMMASSVIKRKFGFRMDSEKLRRKKARLAELSS
ncbi:uncharacterized protein ACMZJ9_019795 [Mantella aurantiaca]